MKRYILIFLTVAFSVAAAAGMYHFIRQVRLGKSLKKPCALPKASLVQIESALQKLKCRQDNEALDIFEQVLLKEPDNLDALWGKAEIKRRSRLYAEAEKLLDKVLVADAAYPSALVSLANVRFQQGRFQDALVLLERVFNGSCSNNDAEALAYVLLSALDSTRAMQGWLVTKLKYGPQIKKNLIKAKELSPDLPEVHLAWGTFYLLAPQIMGGNLDKAIKEFEIAVAIAPEFATANARLAQGYKQKRNMVKFNLYLEKVKKLDPENEVLKELLSVSEK